MSNPEFEKRWGEAVAQTDIRNEKAPNAPESPNHACGAAKPVDPKRLLAEAKAAQERPCYEKIQAALAEHNCALVARVAPAVDPRTGALVINAVVDLEARME